MASKKQGKKNSNGISGNPAKRSVQKITTAASWNKVRAFELALPSGNVALVRRPGLPELLAADLFPDEMMNIVNQSMDEARARLQGKEPDEKSEKTEEEFLQELMENPAKVASMYETFDRVLEFAVVAPKVRFHKDESGAVIPISDRDPDVVYTDDVLEEDKIFIFQFVTGGSSDVARFRQEQVATVAAVQDGRGLFDPPKPDSAD